MLGKGEMQTSRQESSCISPTFTFAYPLTVDKEYPLPQNITPLAPWEKISAIPSVKLPETTDDSNTVFSNSYEKLSFVLGQKGKEELWGFRTIYSDPPPTIQNRSSLLIYNIHKKEWIESPGAFKNISQEISGLYLSSDRKHIWAVSQEPTTVSVYNHEKEIFEPIKLSSSKEGIIYFDKVNDRFWLFEEHNELYSIDPITAQLQFRTAIPAMPLLPSSVAIASNGDLYFVAASSLGPFNELFKFRPDNNSLEQVNDYGVHRFGVFFSVFIDQSENLWIESQGWRDNGGVWHKLFTSPVFVGEEASGVEISDSKRLTMQTAYIIFESSDRRLWFRAINGISWLDLQAEQWCKFTTYGLYDNVSMLEDSQHTVWMIADQKLYKYPLVKK
jgi:hypothetical protein